MTHGTFSELQAQEILDQSRQVVESGNSTLSKSVLRMVNVFHSHEISFQDLSLIIQNANKRVTAEIDAYPVASIEQALLPWPSETIASLIAIRLGQYALAQPDDPNRAVQELRQLKRLLADHATAKALEKKAQEEAKRKNYSDGHLFLMSLIAASALPAMRESEDPVARDMADVIETMMAATAAGLEGQSNKALDLLPPTEKTKDETPRLTLAQMLKGRMGTAEGPADLSEDTGKKFALLMQEKHQAGHL